MKKSDSMHGKKVVFQRKPFSLKSNPPPRKKVTIIDRVGEDRYLGVEDSADENGEKRAYVFSANEILAVIAGFLLFILVFVL